MSEETRKKADEIGSYLMSFFSNEKVTDQTITAKIEKALDEAERRGAEKGFLEGQKQMRERAASLSESHDCMHCGHVGCQEKCLSAAIRALPLEGPKDGRK